MSLRKENGGAAFPSSGHQQWEPQGGMTLRDYFAAKALPLAWDALADGFLESQEESVNADIATCAYQLADAMLKERAK